MRGLRRVAHAPPWPGDHDRLACFARVRGPAAPLRQSLPLVAPCISKEGSAKLEGRRPRAGQADRSWVAQDRREAGSSRSSRLQPEQLPEPPRRGELASTRPGQVRESRRTDQPMSTTPKPQWVGIDVSKATLAVCVYPNGAQWQTANRQAQWQALAEQLTT